MLNPAEDEHRRQAGVSDENEEGGCEYETVQPVRMECGYATLRRLSTVSGIISRLISDFSFSHRGIEEFMKSLCPLSARKFLAVDHPRTACDTALTYENKHVRTAGSKEHGRSFPLARL